MKMLRYLRTGYTFKTFIMFRSPYAARSRVFQSRVFSVPKKTISACCSCVTETDACVLRMITGRNNARCTARA